VFGHRKSPWGATAGIVLLAAALALARLLGGGNGEGPAMQHWCSHHSKAGVCR